MFNICLKKKNLNFYTNKLIFVCLLLFIGFFALSANLLAQQSDTTLNTNTNSESQISTTTDNTDDIAKLNEQITQKKSKIEELQKDIEVYKQALEAKQTEKLTLNNHISILDGDIKTLEMEIDILQQQIDANGLEIENLKLDIHNQEEKITEHTELLEELLRILSRNDRKSFLDILLENQSFSEYYNYSHSLTSLNGQLTDVVQQIKDLKTSLEDKKGDLEDKVTELSTLQTDLSTKKDTLIAQRQSKFDILEQTQNDESTFQKLVQDVRDEESGINTEIATMSETVQKRIEEQERLKNENTNSNTNNSSNTNQDNSIIVKKGTGVIDWPIISRRITSLFHDPGYIYRRYFEHPAIDIATPQGTNIQAADGGVVAIAKKLDWVKNSKGKIIYPAYNYVLIVHTNGLSTVYGHLSGVNVVEGEIIEKGHIIGKGGGLPGTAGAGRLTTGPHLHFEVRLNGIPVNPLDYLP